MHPARLLLPVLLLAAACSSTPPETSSPATVPTTPIAAGECALVVQPGEIINDKLIDQGCIDENGAKRLGKVRVCKNGQRLWEMAGYIGMGGKAMLRETDRDQDGLTARSLNELLCTT